MKLYNRTLTRREVEARVGRIEQIGGVRRMRLTEGFEDGTSGGDGKALRAIPNSKFHNAKVRNRRKV